MKNGKLFLALLFVCFAAFAVPKSSVADVVGDQTACDATTVLCTDCLAQSASPYCTTYSTQIGTTQTVWCCEDFDHTDPNGDAACHNTTSDLKKFQCKKDCLTNGMTITTDGPVCMTRTNTLAHPDQPCTQNCIRHLGGGGGGGE